MAICPPSNGSNGIRLNIPTNMFIENRSEITEPIPDCTAWDATLTMPTGDSNLEEAPCELI
jgi:hypothetical protein